MNVLDAAERVLLERGVPMPIDRIAEIVLKSGLWTSAGRTPKTSVASRIYADMKHLGAQSRFVKTRVGTVDIRNAESLFSAADWTGEGTTPQERAAHRKFVEDIDATPADEFETAIRKILEGAGIRELKSLSRPDDHDGDDVNLEGFVTLLGSISVRIVVLAVRWPRGVSTTTIDRVRRELVPGDRGVVFSTHGFSDEAQQAAESDGEPPIALFTGEDLEKMLE